MDRTGLFQLDVCGAGDLFGRNVRRRAADDFNTVDQLRRNAVDREDAVVSASGHADAWNSLQGIAGRYRLEALEVLEVIGQNGCDRLAAIARHNGPIDDQFVRSLEPGALGECRATRQKGSS